MKHFTLIILLSVFSMQSFSQVFLPQLQAGEYISDSLEVVGGCFTGTCDTLHDIRVSLNNNLIPVVQGVEIKLVVTQLTTPPDSVYTLENGIVHLFDTLAFSSTANSHYTFYSSSVGCYMFKLIINGIPTTPFETYPCFLQSICTLPLCGADCDYAGFPPPCTVDDFVGVGEIQKNTFNLTVHPNPVTDNIFKLSYHLPANKIVSLLILDNTGRLVYEKELPVNSINESIHLSNISSGIYKCMLRGDGIIASKIFIINSK